MSNFGFSRNLTFVEQGGFDTSTTLLSAVTTGAGSEPTPTEIIASTDADSDFLVIYFYSSGSSVEEASIDVCLGGSGSEQPIIENIPFSGRLVLTGVNDCMAFPVTIPAGSRVSVRIIADSAFAMNVGISLYKSGEKGESYSGAKGYGIVANYGGTPVDPGGTANTKNATPVELVSSTAETIKGFWIHVGINENLTINAATGVLVDILIGANPDEVAIVQNHFVISTINESTISSVFYDIVIPAGTRISAKIQCSDTDATDRIKTVALVGLI